MLSMTGWSEDPMLEWELMLKLVQQDYPQMLDLPSRMQINQKSLEVG